MKKIAYITGSRAEYGIMKRLLKKIIDEKEIELDIIVTGMHLEEKYGNTYQLIEKDGFKIKKIDIDIKNKNNFDILNSMGIALQKFGEFFENNKYDSIILLGDRYEILSVAIAAAMHNIPIIHLHGGEKTLGNYDEFIRHSITKMSKLHLVSTEEYRKRVIQLGENPEMVINIGALGAENSLLLNIPKKDTLLKYIKNDTKEYFVIVFHPETLTEISLDKQVDNLLSALEELKDSYNFIFIGSNSDTGSDKIIKKIKNFCEENRFSYIPSVTTEEYLGLIKYSKGLIGNSSSGLIEVPSLKVPTINIGDRQKGRTRGKSVIDIKAKRGEILEAIKKSQTKEFKEVIIESENPYYQNNVLDKAYQEIKKFINSEKKSKIKDFYDLGVINEI